MVLVELKSICRLELPSGNQMATFGEDWGYAQNAFGLLQCCGSTIAVCFGLLAILSCYLFSVCVYFYLFALVCVLLFCP